MINDSKSASEKCIELLKGIERLSLKPYDDQTGRIVKKWCKGATIGYGHLIAKHEWSRFENVINEFQADDLFFNDLYPFEDCIKKLVVVNIKQHQFDALVIFAFNIGTTAFRQSSALKMINDPRAVTDYATLELAWKAFNKQRKNGVLQKNDGLVNRRNAEWNLWQNGVYESW